jgi:hypothetical protein
MLFRDAGLQESFSEQASFSGQADLQGSFSGQADLQGSFSGQANLIKTHVFGSSGTLR